MAENTGHRFPLSTKHAKLLQIYDKSLSFGENYVEIYEDSSTIIAELLLLEFKTKKQKYIHCNSFL